MNTNTTVQEMRLLATQILSIASEIEMFGENEHRMKLLAKVPGMYDALKQAHINTIKSRLLIADSAASLIEEKVKSRAVSKVA